ARGQFDVRERAFATRLDGKLKNRVQLVLGNHECLPPTLVTLQERSLTWKFRLELGQDLLKVSFRKNGCNGVIKNLRFFIELQAPSSANAARTHDGPFIASFSAGDHCRRESTG